MADTVFIGKVYGEIKTIMTDNESTISSEIAALSDNASEQPTQAVLLKLQYKMQVFTFFAEFCSTMEKKVGDSFQGIVRNF